MAIVLAFPKDVGDLVALQTEATIAAESFTRCTFDWDENTGIPCVAGPLMEGKELGIGGWDLRKKCKVRVRVAELPVGERPKTNDNIIIHLSDSDTDGTKMRVLSTERSFDVFIEMTCVDTNHP